MQDYVCRVLRIVFFIWCVATHHTGKTKKCKNKANFNKNTGEIKNETESNNLSHKRHIPNCETKPILLCPDGTMMKNKAKYECKSS